MDKQFTTTSASPNILLFISGDLRLKGQDEFEVMAKSDNPEDLSLEAREDQVVIRCHEQLQCACAERSHHPH